MQTHKSQACKSCKEEVRMLGLPAHGHSPYQTGLFSITTFQLASYSMDMHIHMQSLLRLLICLQMSDVSLHKHMQMQTARLPPCT